MNEGKKTGIFWGVAAAMMAIATIVAWPPSEDNSSGVNINQALFKDFKDPLSAASMKIVTFDEEQGQLDTFEVRKDRETGAWTIPSRQGYPADAVEQMKDAANALVDLRILDVQTSNAEDHDDLGVAEPALEELEIGDEGVGRLVTLKDESQKTLASLIIGDPVKDREGQRYVRKPGQDPVYVVKLDESPITTDFQKWIEDDLLKLSSIDVDRMQIKDYNASLNIGGQISLTRNYTANVSMDGSTWKLDLLQEYDSENPMADPKTVEVGEDDTLNTTKLNEIKNALDDLKIVNVVRKPEGMSANLRANKDLTSDNKAVSSLASRGFYPVQMGPQGEFEVLSANGELTVGLKDGVQYVMRFGNIAGLSGEEGAGKQKSGEEDEQAAGGVNRYLLVTTRVDESRFPAPKLKTIPQTLEELEELLNPKEETPQEKESEPATEPKADQDEPAADKADDADKPADDAKPSDDAKADDQPPADGDKKSADEKAADEKPADEADASAEASEEKTADEPDNSKQESGESEGSGSGEGSGTGQGQEPAQDGDNEPAKESTDEPKQEDAADPVADEKPAEPAEARDAADKKSADDAPATADDAKSDDAKVDDAKADDATADDAKADDATADDAKADDAKADDAKAEELSDEEKQERLEAEQEKITKENQRLMDERKDKIEAARKRVDELNARFADWYYVIPEETYSKLRISRDDLFEKPKSDTPATSLPPSGLPPQFQFPTPK